MTVREAYSQTPVKLGVGCKRLRMITDTEGVRGYRHQAWKRYLAGRGVTEAVRFPVALAVLGELFASAPTMPRAGHASIGGMTPRSPKAKVYREGSGR